MSIRRENDHGQGGVERVRRDGDAAAGAAAMAYADQTAAGQPRQVSGDDKFPFFKDPPDLAGEFCYYDSSRGSAGLPYATTLAGYVTLPEINTDGFTRLCLTVDFTPGALAGMGGAAGVLSMIHQELSQAGTLWRTTGVIDPTLHIPPLGTQARLPIDDGYAWRAVYASELIFDPFVGLTPPYAAPGALSPFSLWFDVASIPAWRLLVADRGNAGGVGSTPSQLRLFCQLQR